MVSLKKWWKELLITILVASNIVVWVTLYQKRSSDILTVYFIDVGQGDAILVDSPQHGRVLIDGGRNRSILSELGRILPFGDTRLDIVIGTHPDFDHIGGLPAVVERYKVGAFLEPGVESDSDIDDELDKRLKEKNIPTILARRGIIVNFGDGAKLQILFPNQDVSNWETNKASVVAKLTYGSKSFLLTGDSPMQVENILLNLDSLPLSSDVLKVGHHGSRTSTSLTYAKTVSPEYVVISAGRDNSYGHPHQEVLDILEKIDAKVVSTADLGTIKFETDGKILKLK